MSDIHDQVHAFSDGELPPAEADAFRDHLGGCQKCQRELHEALQADHAFASVRPVPVRQVTPLWQRRELQAGLALAAAVTLFFLVPSLRTDQAIAPVGPRHLEARVSWPLADSWRPYEAVRGGTLSDTVPMSSLAVLEKNGQSQFLASAWLVMGDPTRAQKLLAGLKPTPDVLADRAAGALADQQPEEALEHAQRALDEAPRHPRALWNKALAAQELGLIRVAAATFGEVMALQEPGWAAEAGQRQRALVAKAKQSEDDFRRYLDAAGQMVLQGTPLTQELAAIAPSSARMFLSYALLAAPSAARVEALSPLARTLDGNTEGVLTQTVRRDAADDFAVRAPLALQFRGVAVDLFRALRVTGFAPKVGDAEAGLGAGGGRPLRRAAGLTEAASLSAAEHSVDQPALFALRRLRGGGAGAERPLVYALAGQREGETNAGSG